MEEHEVGTRLAMQDQQIASLRQTLYGISGQNGMYGAQKEANERMTKIEEKLEGVYKMLAVASLALVASALGVVVTLITTAGT